MILLKKYLNILYPELSGTLAELSYTNIKFALFYAGKSYNKNIFMYFEAEKRRLQPMQTIRESPACPVETTLMLIGDKWKVLILRDLMPGTKRFGELKKSVGNVSQKVLTAQLRDMEENGLVNRKVYAEVPPRVEYSLTELGKSLKPILDAMWNWGEGYKAKNS